jgi:hypothetical protein
LAGGVERGGQPALLDGGYRYTALAFAGVMRLAVPSTTPRIARAAQANFFTVLSVSFRASRV